MRDSAFWLLREPVVYGTRLRCESEPSVVQKLLEAKVLTLGHVVEVCGPRLDRTAALASRLGIRYSRRTKVKGQLLNFLVGQAKMAVYLSRRNMVERSGDADALEVLKRMLKVRLKTDFSFYRLTKNLEEFEKLWSFRSVLVSVDNDELLFGLLN
ncbi:uncharacterized protein V6R79_001803 [Siganus canaliculatus]